MPTTSTGCRGRTTMGRSTHRVRSRTTASRSSTGRIRPRHSSPRHRLRRVKPTPSGWVPRRRTTAPDRRHSVTAGVQVVGVSRRFGSKEAISDVTFDVEHGEVLGLLGPNGAGKTTTMRVMTGYLRPTTGRVVVGGVEIA